MEIGKLFKGLSIKKCDHDLELISTNRLKNELKRRTEIKTLSKRIEKINNKI